MHKVEAKAIRSVGQLQIGKPDKIDNIFSVDFLFTAKGQTIGEDEMKSVSLEIGKQFQRLLMLNGFWNIGEKHPMPEMAVRQVAPNMVHFICAVVLPPKGPIVVRADA